MKHKKIVTYRKKPRTRSSSKQSKDRSFSRLAFIILIGLVGVGFWLYYHQSVKDKESPETKLNSLILENPEAEVLEMEEEKGQTNQSSTDESVPEVFRMEE